MDEGMMLADIIVWTSSDKISLHQIVHSKWRNFGHSPSTLTNMEAESQMFWRKATTRCSAPDKNSYTYNENHLRLGEVAFPWASTSARHDPYFSSAAIFQSYFDGQ